MKKHKKLIIATITVVALIAAGVGAFKLFAPYAVTVDGNIAFVVENKSDGEVAIKTLVTGYVPKDTKVTSVTLENHVKLRQLNPAEVLEHREILNKKEAIAYIENADSQGNPLFNVEIKSDIEIEEVYTPETKYIKDDKALAGSMKVEVEGQEGKRIATYRITSLNGQEKNKELINEDIIEEGVAAVIHKGTLGLPEGEDWKTYEGMPVYNSGDDITTTALQHLGAPYKYGGYSFVTGLDCVQYVRNIYKMYGVRLPNNHPGLQKVGTGVSLKNARPGDIVCYKHHVAIYIGNGKIAEAVPKKGTRIAKATRKPIITIRRVNH